MNIDFNLIKFSSVFFFSTNTYAGWTLTCFSHVLLEFNLYFKSGQLFMVHYLSKWKTKNFDWEIMEWQLWLWTRTIKKTNLCFFWTFLFVLWYQIQSNIISITTWTHSKRSNLDSIDFKFIFMISVSVHMKWFCWLVSIHFNYAVLPNHCHTGQLKRWQCSTQLSPMSFKCFPFRPYFFSFSFPFSTYDIELS